MKRKIRLLFRLFLLFLQTNRKLSGDISDRILPPEIHIRRHGFWPLNPVSSRTLLKALPDTTHILLLTLILWVLRAILSLSKQPPIFFLSRIIRSGSNTWLPADVWRLPLIFCRSNVRGLRITVLCPREILLPPQRSAKIRLLPADICRMSAGNYMNMLFQVRCFILLMITQTFYTMLFWCRRIILLFWT